MKKFLFSILIFIITLFVASILVVFVGSTIVKHRNFKNWETESNLLVLHPNKHYNYIFIGNSHTRNFSRYKNHLLTEKILGKSFLNLGKTGANIGVNEYLIYMRYCYNHNITADTIIHNVITQMYFSDRSNIASDGFEDEPFDFDFFRLMLFSSEIENKWQKIYYYLRSKTYRKWISLKPFSLNSKIDSLSKIDTSVVNKSLKEAFPSGHDMKNFLKYTASTEKMIQLVHSHNEEIIFITTPALFGEWTYSDDLKQFMKQMRTKYGVKYYDFSTTINDPHLFYDHHHLNSKGLTIFLEKYLKPALNGDTTYLVN